MSCPKIPIHEYIRGDIFQEICDVTFDRNMVSSIHSLDGPKRIFTATHDLRVLFDALGTSKHRHIVVSHNSDGNVLSKESGRPFDFTWERIPEQLYHLFVQNCDIRSSKVTPIPIGFENKQYFPRERKLAKLAARAEIGCPKEQLVLVCHSVWTNPERRIKPYLAFAGEPWATVLDGRNGIDYDEYLFQLARHHFVISPEGNGIDCVRHWEALTLGTIPIVEPRVCTLDFATRVPMLFRLGDTWRFDQDYLESAAVELRNEHQYRPFEYDIMRASYWKETIDAKYRELTC